MMPLARMLDVGVDARDNQVGMSGGVLAQMVGLLAPIGQGALPRVIKVLLNVSQEQSLKIGDKSLSEWVGKIHCIDCIKLMDSLPKDSISVIVTSPPYNIKNSTGNGMKDGRGGKWSDAVS